MGAPKIHAQSPEQHESLGFKVRVVSHTETSGHKLARELEQALHGWIQLDVTSERDAQAEPGQVIFVDASAPDLAAILERHASVQAVAGGACVFLIVREGDGVPSALIEGRVDDVLVHPFRSLEVLGKLRHFQKLQEHRESLELNASYAKIVELLHEDLKLAERLQKQRLPRRFPEVKGFRVTSRYMAGERSGGDYVDMADTRDGQSLAIVMTDASSYRLSSAALDSVSRKLASLAADELRSCVTAARRIRDGVLINLGDRDQLALFYGVLSRKDYRLKFVNLGGTRVFYAPPAQAFSELKDGQGDPIVKAMSVRTENEGELALEPEGRLALVSDGFVETAGGAAEVLKILNEHRAGPAADSLNELVFRTKKGLASPEDLPAQDCTAVLFDVDSRLIRLA